MPIEEISTAVVATAVKDGISFLKTKLKGDNEVKNLEKAIKNLSKSINTYFELYGYSLDVYTTADDAVKILLVEGPVEFRGLYAEVNYNGLRGKFDNGLKYFHISPGRVLDKEDKSLVIEHIGKLEMLFGKSEIHLKSKNYNELKETINEIAATSNKIRVLSRQRLLSLFEALREPGD